GRAAQRRQGPLNTNSGIPFLLDRCTDDDVSPDSFRSRRTGKTQKSVITGLLFDNEPAKSHRQTIKNLRF
ncbi:hypothetical protein K443DRAFT_110734, partial [Laccaria amethystina LaAM-08-1]